MFDCRTTGQHKKWSVGSSCEVERLAWDHFSPHRLLASTDQGQVVCVDLRFWSSSLSLSHHYHHHCHCHTTIIIIVIVRNDSKPVWTLSAHSEAVTGLALSSQCPGCLVTTSQV